MARKPHKYHYIYKTICNITGKYYIGMHSCSNLEDGYMGSGVKIRRSLNRHGIENHTKEILEFLDDRESLKKRESEIVNENMIQDPLCMNLQLGGGGGFSSDEHREKNLKSWQLAGQAKLKECYIDDEWHNKISLKIKELWKSEDYRSKILPNIDWTGRSHSEETKNKIGKSNSIKQKGENNSQSGTCWITNGTENKKIKKDEQIPEGWKLGRKIKYGK